MTMTNATHSSSMTDADGNIVYTGDPAGFVITLEDGYRIYFAGDTAVFSGMSLIGELYTARPGDAADRRLLHDGPLGSGQGGRTAGREAGAGDALRHLPGAGRNARGAARRAGSPRRDRASRSRSWRRETPSRDVLAGGLRPGGAAVGSGGCVQVPGRRARWCRGRPGTWVRSPPRRWPTSATALQGSSCCGGGHCGAGGGGSPDRGRQPGGGSAARRRRWRRRQRRASPARRASIGPAIAPAQATRLRAICWPGQAVVAALAETFESTAGPLVERLLAALAGRRRGRRRSPRAPVGVRDGAPGRRRLRRQQRRPASTCGSTITPTRSRSCTVCTAIHDLLFGSTPEADLIPLEQVEGELSERLSRARLHGSPAAALEAWADIENLEERLHPGRIDPVVLRLLRHQSDE